MKTKSILLATAGSTVDGRNIDDKMLKEMASSYKPATYGSRVNIEHIRGISGDGPFRAYGDILELSTGEIEVDFNGKKEKRTALYGVLDLHDDAKALIDAGQKVYPSIEIEPNFGGQGFAYCMGVAMTDSPAAIATQRWQFNRRQPGTLHVEGEEAIALELAEAAGDDDAADGFVGKFGAMLDNFATKFGLSPKKDEPKPEDKKDDPAVTSDAAAMFAMFRPLFEGVSQTFTTELKAARQEFRQEFDGLGLKVKKLEDGVETNPARHFTPRPPSDGKAGQYADVF